MRHAASGSEITRSTLLCAAKLLIFSWSRASGARKATKKEVKVLSEEAVTVLGFACHCVCGVAKVGGTGNWFRFIQPVQRNPRSVRKRVFSLALFFHNREASFAGPVAVLVTWLHIA